MWSGARLFSFTFGAYSEHALREQVTDQSFRSLMTAIRYNQEFALMISAMGIALSTGGKLAELRTFMRSAWLFVIGTLLFSFSIYLSVTVDLPRFVSLPPVGGTTIMVAWLLLLATGWKSLKERIGKARVQ